MSRIKLNHLFPDQAWERQTPGGKGLWEDHSFHSNDDIDECDYWVVYGNVPGPQTCICPPENVIFICGEPPGWEILSPKFLAQFAAVVSCHRRLKHKRSLHLQQALPWHAGIAYNANTRRYDPQKAQTYDELATAQPVKTKLASVICSNMGILPGHHVRRIFVDRLQEALGDEIDLFGRGIRDFSDKWDVIAPYRYHIAIENSSVANYWTEKLSDAFLAEAYPIYSGCPNIDRYFAKEALSTIDITDTRAAISTIKQIIGSDIDRQTLDIRREAKRLVMNKYNLFPFILSLRQYLDKPSTPRPVTIQPKGSCETVSYKAAHVLNQVRNRVSVELIRNRLPIKLCR
jgi:hypothetical protein